MLLRIPEILLGMFEDQLVRQKGDAAIRNDSHQRHPQSVVKAHQSFLPKDLAGRPRQRGPRRGPAVHHAAPFK